VVKLARDAGPRPGVLGGRVCLQPEHRAESSPSLNRLARGESSIATAFVTVNCVCPGPLADTPLFAEQGRRRDPAPRSLKASR